MALQLMQIQRERIIALRLSGDRYLSADGHNGSIISVSSATEHASSQHDVSHASSQHDVSHASSQHDVSHHGDSTPTRNFQNTIVPFGMQIQDTEHVLSTQDVACISADSNIFEIMDKAQESCNGTDMRCTFYHFVNHGYNNIGTLDIDKELFDDLLMKFDNWLLTAENIEENDEPLNRKTKEDNPLHTEIINMNGSYSNEETISNSTHSSDTEKLYTNHGVHIDNIYHNTNESDDDKIANTHHIKNVFDTHHRNHHHKSKNGNHIRLVPEYNNEHRYFEVFLPKDKETGKPRTIYVEVDKDKNEFVLLDEEIDKKLNGVKPIRIELDELSEIADTAFNNIAKSAKHKQHIYNSNDDDRIMTSDVNTHSEINEDTTNLDINVGESTQNILNPSIRNINTNQQLISDNKTGNVKKIVNIGMNLVAPNKYINEAQFHVESHIDNTTHEIPNDHLELLESSNNETDIYQTGFDEESPLDTIEFNENNTNIVDLDNIEYSPESFDILSDDNSTKHYELSTEDENVTFGDDSFIQLEENNDTSINTDFGDTHDFSTSETVHLNEPISQTEKHVQENKPKSTPKIYTEPQLTPSLTAGISDYSSSQRDAIPSDNRQGHIQEHSSEPGIPLSSYTNVPIMGKDLAKVLETDSHLQSAFPVYATLDLPAGASQKSPLDSDFQHPSISSYNTPLDSGFGHTGPEIFPHTSQIFPTPRPQPHNAAPNLQYTSPVFPSPPVECVVRLNKGSEYSPLNFGFSWLPSYSRIEELRLPWAMNSSPQESILQLPVQKNKQITDSISAEPSSPDHTTPIEDPRLFYTVPSLSINSQEPSLSTVPYHLEENVPPKHTLPSKLDLRKSLTDLDRMSTAYELSETPITVIPYKLQDAVNSPCHMQQIPLYLQQAKPNAMDLELIKYSPFDNNFKETMIPCSANRNRYPYTKIPCFANPYLKPPQITPPYLEPLLSVTPLQPSSKIPLLDLLPISLDQSYPYLNGDYRQETKPISLLPNKALSPLNPQLLGPGFIPNTLPCQNLWNNIPNLPCTILPDQNKRNYPPILSNYVTPTAVLQQNPILKPLLSKSVPSSVLEQPCQAKNILEMTPLSYTSFLQPVQMDLNPSLALERDLQSLSLKYGIPLSKILNSLETEISDAHRKASAPTLEVPYSKLVHDSSLTIKPISTKTNAALDDENRSGYEEPLLDSDLTNLVPLDSFLTGPHLELENSLMLESNYSQSHTVISDTTVLPSSHSRPEKPTTKVIHDSSLIGPNLPTLSTSNFVLNDENRNTNEHAISESDITNSILLDSSLIGPHLEIGSPPIVLDSNNSHSDILASLTDVPITVSSQIEQKINLNQPTNLVPDSSLIGSHLLTLSPIKPLLNNEIQNINDMIPLETDLTDLTLLESAVKDTQKDLVNQLEQIEILQHEKTAVTLTATNASTKLYKTTEYLPKNLVEDELLLESDFSRLIPLDSSLIGPELKLGSLPIITDSLEDKAVPQASKESIQQIDNKVDGIKRPSLLPTLLNKTVKADSNLNINTKETKLNEGLDVLSIDTNVELPVTDISFKENDFEIVEPIPKLPSLAIDVSNIPFKHKSKSSDISPVVDSETILDNSLTDISILHKLETPEISTSLDSSIHLDSSLIGPSILQEIDSREISPILDSDSSLAPTTINQNDKPSEIFTVIDSSNKLGSSFKSPTIHHEINSKETSTAFESVTQFDNSLVPSLHETKEFPAMSSISKSQLDSSIIGPSLHQEILEVSRGFDFKDIRDSSLVGPRLLTVPFSSDEIQMINKELQSESDLANLVPLDSSLIGPHVDFESELEQSEISRYQNPELSKTSVSNPDVYDTTNLIPLNLVEGKSPLEPIIVSSVCASDLEELLSKFTNAITKSQLSPTELKPCDKLLSSIAEISSDNKNIQPYCKDLQTLTLNTLLNTPLSLQDELASEFHPITITFPAQEFSPVQSIANGLDSNYFPTPTTIAESRLYSQGVPQTPITPYSPFIQMKPMIDRNWLGPKNMQNILQTSPNFRPVLRNPPAPFTYNALPWTSEDLKSLLDLASYSNIYPQLSIPRYTPGDAIPPSSQWTTPSNISPLNEYVILLPKEHSAVLPIESTIANSEYNPIVADDIMSLLDENSLQLLKDTSILPFSQSSLLSTIPVFENGEIVSPSLLENMPIVNSDFIKTRPLLPIPVINPLVPSSNYNPQIRLHNSQNVPYMIETPNFILPCNLQPYSNTPLHSQFSKIIEPAPNFVPLPTESPKALLQQLLPKPYLKSPIILPSASLDTMLQLPIASNELNSVLSQLPPEYFIPISPIYTTPLPNELTKPVLPTYASPLSVSLAKPPPSTSLPLNIPYVDSPLTTLPIPITPYIDRLLPPKFSSQFMPLNITPISDYAHPPAVPHNRPITSDIPYKPSSQTYSSPYLPVHPSPIPIDKSPGSPNIMTKLPPAIKSPISPVLYEPLSTPCFIPESKSLTNLGLPANSGPLTQIVLSSLAPTPTGLLSPAYLSPTNSYPSLLAPMNTQTRPSNLLPPASITPISPVSSSLSTPLSFNPKIITPELKSRLLNTLPISNAVSPFLNANQWLPTNSNIPLQSYPTHVSKPLPSSFSNSRLKQYIPSEHILESNLLTSTLTEEIPPYDVIEKSAYTYSNDKDDKYYEEPSLKYPLESESYTLAPEEIAETLPPEDFKKLEDLTPSATVSNRGSEPSLHTQLYQHLGLTPYTPLYSKSLLKPRPAPQVLLPPSFTENIPQNIYDNIPLVPSSSPLKHSVSLPTSILCSPLLKPLAPFTSAPNFPISSPIFSIPFIDTSLTPEKLQSLSSSPYYSAPSQDMSAPPNDPRESRNLVTPQVTPVFSQVPTNTPFVPVSSAMSVPKSQPSILDNYIQLPSTHYEPKTKTSTSQGSLAKPSSIPHYNQYVEPIISHIPPLEMPITPQYITPLPPAASLKKSVITPQYMSSILPAQTRLQESIPLNEAPIHYKPYIPQPTGLTSSANNIFESTPVTSPYTVLPSRNMVEPVSKDLNRLQSSSLNSHYSLPSTPLPVSKYSPIIAYSNLPYSSISPHISKQALINHIKPFMSSAIGFQTPTNNPPYNIPKYSSPSPFLTEPLETVPFNNPSRPLDTTANPQNILKPKSLVSSIQHTVPLPSSPYHTQPLQPTDFNQTQPLSNVQYTTKPHSKLSPFQAQYASPSSAPTYTSLPLETVPYRQMYKPRAPQYNYASIPAYDSSIHVSPLTRNPFLIPDFKPITEVPSYPVPNNILSLPDSILSSNLKPLDISQESQNSYSSPITTSAPLSSPSLSKNLPTYLNLPLAKRLPLKSRQYQPHTSPSNLQYVSQIPIESVPELLPSTSQLLKSSLVTPLSTNSQSNAPLVPITFSNTNPAFPEVSPIEAIPSAISPDIALSNYLPLDSSNHKHSSPYDALVSEIPEIVTPTNPSSTTPYISLKSPFNKHFKSPVSTVTNMPLYSNYDILEPSPKLPIKASLMNSAKPVEVSATSALESSPLSLDSLDTEMIDEIEPYEQMPGSKDRFLPLPLSYNQQKQFHPASKYLATPQPYKTLPSAKYKTSRPRPSFSISSLIPDEAELTDTTDFISLSQIKSEPLIADYTSSDRLGSKSNTPSNIAEPDILQFSPYTTLLNTEFPLSTNKKLLTPRYSNQILQPLPIHLNPQEYKDLIQGPSPSQAPSSLPIVLSPTNTEPQLVTSPLTGRPSPQIPYYTSSMSIAPEHWLQSPTFAKSLPLKEMPLEVTPGKESIQSLLNKYIPANKITPQANNYPYELDSIKPVNHLLKTKEPYTEYIEDSKSNEDNYHDPESDIVSSDENRPNSFKSKSFTKSPPEIMKGVGVPNYNIRVQKPQRISKLDTFYAKNHIGKGPQVYTIPTYNTLPVTSPTGVKSPSSSVSPEILKDFTDIPTTHFGSVPKLDTTSLPSEYYLNPYLKYSSQMKSPPNTIEIADTSEITPISNIPVNNIDDIKYSGYKTYQIPPFKSPQTLKNLGTPTQMYSPSVVTYSSPIRAVKPSTNQQNPSHSYFNRPAEVSEPLMSEYQMTTPIQTKLNLDSLQESPELNGYNPIEDIPTSVDSRNEDNELKTSLINYINRREHVKNNLFNNKAEITIPLGNIAITRKEPYDVNTIETNNPSIGLKVWKSNVKIAETELKLKFKDLSVNNFMPIVNNLDKYDMEEIRKIVKNYIDEKYGNHIEINEPCIIDNKFTVIKDFDHNAVDNKYNLLWPTNYV